MLFLSQKYLGMFYRCKRILLVLPFFFVLTTTAQESKYVKKYKPIAKALAKEFQIPYEVIMGIAIVESGEGNTKVSKLYNNHFGIVGKNKAKNKTKYRHFNSPENSFRSFCSLVKRRNFYDTLKGNPDYKVWIEALSRTGYSTQPIVWKNKINKVIQEKFFTDKKKK